jgi:hypothetical protein
VNDRPIDAIEQRDRGMQTLRDLTTAALIAAAGLLVAFSMMAAITLPGHSDAGGGNANTSTGPSTFFGGDDQLRGPSNGAFQGGGGRPIAVTGGSH